MLLVPCGKHVRSFTAASAIVGCLAAVTLSLEINAPSTISETASFVDVTFTRNDTSSVEKVDFATVDVTAVSTGTSKRLVRCGITGHGRQLIHDPFQVQLISTT